MIIFSNCSTCCNAGNKRCYHRNLQIVIVVQSLSFIFLWTHGLQYSRLPCPSPSPRVQTHDHCQWCHSTIWTYASPFSSGSQSFTESGSFPMSWLFPSGGQSVGASASASGLSMDIQGWFPLGLTGLIFLQSKVLSKFFSSITVWKHQFFSNQPSLWSNSHIYMWLLEKLSLWLHRHLSAKWCLCFLICYLGLSQFFFQGVSIF